MQISERATATLRAAPVHRRGLCLGLRSFWSTSMLSTMALRLNSHSEMAGKKRSEGVVSSPETSPTKGWVPPPLW